MDSLRDWVKKAELSQPLTAEELAEIRRLKRQVRELEEQRGTLTNGGVLREGTIAEESSWCTPGYRLSKPCSDPQSIRARRRLKPQPLEPLRPLRLRRARRRLARRRPASDRRGAPQADPHPLYESHRARAAGMRQPPEDPGALGQRDRRDDGTVLARHLCWLDTCAGSILVLTRYWGAGANRAPRNRCRPRAIAVRF